jgi:methionyl-tRNA formyltransferase
VKRAAEARGLRVFAPEKLKPFVDEVRPLGADAFVVASYGKIVPQALLDVVPIAFNVHPSLLPLYRGATPLQSAIRDGRTETGVTIIAMDAGMDTGDVLLQERTPLGADETYGELHDRLAQRGAALVVDAVERYANGTFSRVPQRELAQRLGIGDDEIARTLTRPLLKDDLTIGWYQPARRIVDHVRSLAPQPLARTTYDGEPVKIVAAHAVSLDDLAAITGGGWMQVVPRGLIVARGARSPLVYVAVDDGGVVVDRLIPRNRGVMSGEAFAQSKFAEFRS